MQFGTCYFYSETLLCQMLLPDQTQVSSFFGEQKHVESGLDES